MNYQEALAYLYSLSDYERGGGYTRDRNVNLAREARLLELLGKPQEAYSSTLIAGTKGKGSTAALVERVLREAGLRTGLYTQPDLHTFRERIRVAGNLIGEEALAELVPELRTMVERLQPELGAYITYEVTTALALLYFARAGVEHAVLEVGLGGRLDATNVTQPLVSVITSISYDHMEILGDTLTKIATEKAGIIKPGGVIVTSAQNSEALLAIAAVSGRQGARLVRIGPAEVDAAEAEVEADRLPALSYRYRWQRQTESGQLFTIETPIRTYENLELGLLGRHQLENATLALATLDLLRVRGGLQWNEKALRAGFQNVNWSARMEIVGRAPTMIVDGAHNADSLQKLMEALQTTFQFRRLIVVLSVNQGKDLPGMVRALANVDLVIVTRMMNPRAVGIEELERLLREEAPAVAIQSAPTSREALDLALRLAEPEDLVCATGSLYLAAEALRWSAAHGNSKIAAAIEGVDHSG